MNMRDMEMLKAMACCVEDKSSCPEYCPRYRSFPYSCTCRHQLMIDLSKFVNEQQEEISRLQKLIASLDTKAMTPEKAIEMIDEYLQEPNSIRADWVEALKLCREALRKEVN